MTRLKMRLQKKKNTRLEKGKKYKIEKIANETLEEKRDRLDKDKNYHIGKIKNETPAEKETRLERDKNYHSNKLANETLEEKNDRLNNINNTRKNMEVMKTGEERIYQLRNVASQMIISRTNEFNDNREIRLRHNVFQHSTRHDNENEEEYKIRLTTDMLYYYAQRSPETPSPKEARLQKDLSNDIRIRAASQVCKDSFWVFADRFCEICTKTCYPNQVANYRLPNNAPSFLPDNLKVKAVLTLCHTCKKHLQDRKKSCHPKSYWNKLDPGKIPDVFKVLTRTEKNLLSRIDAFVKVIKYDGIFGQYGFKSQAVLFAKDIFEVIEKLPVLPRSTLNSNIILVTEKFENINITKEFNINRNNLIVALVWLVKNNCLYGDIVIDNEVRLDRRDLIRTESLEKLNSGDNHEVNVADYPSSYRDIGSSSRIIRAGYHQGSAFLNSNHAGRQCCAMALTTLVRAELIPPQKWKTHHLDGNLIAGNKLYDEVVINTKEHPNSIPIPQSGYLLIQF